MKTMFKVLSLVMLGLFLVGCESNQDNETKQQLIQLAKKDVTKYFANFTEQFKESDYTTTFLNHKLLIEQETNQAIYKGDRIIFLAKEYPSKSGIRELEAEYDANKLIALKLTIDSKEDTLEEVDEVALSQQFIALYKLATHAEYIQTQHENELSIVKFSNENEEIIKIYVNNEINAVVGFALYDSLNK